MLNNYLKNYCMKCHESLPEPQVSYFCGTDDDHCWEVCLECSKKIDQQLHEAYIDICFKNLGRPLSRVLVNKLYITEEVQVPHCKRNRKH